LCWTPWRASSARPQAPERRRNDDQRRQRAGRSPSAIWPGTILGLLGKELPIVCEEERVRPAGSEVERLCADNRLARQVLGWQPQSHAGGGAGVSTIAWVEEHLERYRPGLYHV
jgi:nucleoside-diphosphate-sugar epimerase